MNGQSRAIRRGMLFVVAAAVAVLPWLPAGSALAAAGGAKAVVVMDAKSGQVLENIEGDRKVGPASLAKMMTLYLIYAAVDRGMVAWDDEVLISTKAWKMGGSKMFLRAGDRVPLKKLVYGIGVVSGNDACIAVAEHLSGSEAAFVDWMNEEAKRLGLTDTTFGSATGLPTPKQITTALDMAKLGRALITDYPESIEVLSTREFTHEKITQKNRNLLLWKDIGVDGIKTGHTEESGFHLVASAMRDDRRFIAAVMGARNEERRSAIAQQHLMVAFRNFVTVFPLKNDAPVAEAVVWKGAVSTLPVMAADVSPITVRRGEEGTVSVTHDVPDVVAPVAAGQQLGTARIMVGDEMVREVALVATADVEKAGFFKRLWHAVLLFFKGLIDKYI